MKDVFDINSLDLAKLCKAFGFSKPPFTNLNIRITPSSVRRKRDKMNDKEKFYNNKEKSNRDSKVQYTY